MKKKVIQTTFLLLVISGISKLLSFAVRILVARRLSDQAVQYTSLAAPVITFLMTLAHFGIPSALTQLVASKKQVHDSLSAAIILSVVNNFLLFVLCLFLIPVYSRLFLKQELMIPVLYATVPLLPLIMMSGLLKGYYLGRQKMVLASSSQITEEIFRLLFLILFLNSSNHNPVRLAVITILSHSVGEIGSCLHLSFTMTFRHFRTRSRNLLPQVNMDAMKQLLKLSLPMTAGRMIGSFTSFIEPTLMIHSAPLSIRQTCLMVFSTLNTYLLPMITLPGFFSIAISSWVLPAFSEAYTCRSDRARLLFSGSTVFSLVIGCMWSLVLFFFSEPLCQLLYHKTDMANMLNMLALPFSVFSTQPILTSVLHGAQKSTKAMINTLIGCIVRLLSMMILCKYHVAYAPLYALMISMLVTTFLHFFSCLTLFDNHQKTIIRP